ncbi:MAG: pyruvate kinase [Nanoarchaeota archaeon]
MHKLTKIVATLGPATDTVEKIGKLYEKGMNVARLNFSHGNYDYFSKLIENIRKIDEDICIILDTKGPELRPNPFKGDSIELEKDQEIFLESSADPSDESTIRFDYPHLDEVEEGTIVYFDDGMIAAKVKSNDGQIKARVLNKGRLLNSKSVTFKGYDLKLPFLTDKDKEDIKFGIKHGLDYVAASYVRSAEDIKELRDFLKEEDSNMGIIAKIEHYFSVKNISGIIRASDGVMVARGDLGVEMDLEKVPLIQRGIISKCNFLGRPVIVATQMLESMTYSPRPTRAEVSDVAHAILQGADAVMLSGETAWGNYPVESVKTMSKLASVYDERVKNVFDESLSDVDDAFTNEVGLFVTKAAYLASKAIKTSAILTPTESGYTARKVSRFRPKCPVLAITRDKAVMRKLQLSWGVFPSFEPTKYSDFEKYVNDLVSVSMQKGFLQKGDMFVITAGHKLHETGTTNLLEIYKVDEILERINSPKEEHFL